MQDENAGPLVQKAGKKRAGKRTKMGSFSFFSVVSVFHGVLNLLFTVVLSKENGNVKLVAQICHSSLYYR